MVTGLEVQGVSVTRDGRTVLRELSFRVDAASTLAVVGPSGVGKTTLLDVLTGILVPDRGDVHLGGFHVTAASRRAVADWRLRHVGVVHQFAELLPELTLLENVQLPRMLAGVPTGEAQATAKTALGILGIKHLAESFPSTVSGGERQRAAIARAVAHHPDLLVADEPTGALDPASAAGATRVLLEAAAEVGAVLVLATHNPEVANQMDALLNLQLSMDLHPA